MRRLSCLAIGFLLRAALGSRSKFASRREEQDMQISDKESEMSADENSSEWYDPATEW